MSSVRVRWRLREIKRVALFEQKKSSEYTQIDDQGAIVKLEQLQPSGVTPGGDLKLVLNHAEAKVFNDAPIGAEFEMVISLVQPEKKAKDA